MAEHVVRFQTEFFDKVVDFVPEDQVVPESGVAFRLREVRGSAGTDLVVEDHRDLVHRVEFLQWE